MARKFIKLHQYDGPVQAERPAKEEILGEQMYFNVRAITTIAYEHDEKFVTVRTSDGFAQRVTEDLGTILFLLGED